MATREQYVGELEQSLGLSREDAEVMADFRSSSGSVSFDSGEEEDPEAQLIEAFGTDVPEPEAEIGVRMGGRGLPVVDTSAVGRSQWYDPAEVAANLSEKEQEYLITRVEALKSQGKTEDESIRTAFDDLLSLKTVGGRPDAPSTGGELDIFDIALSATAPRVFDIEAPTGRESRMKQTREAEDAYDKSLKAAQGLADTAQEAALGSGPGYWRLLQDAWEGELTMPASEMPDAMERGSAKMGEAAGAMFRGAIAAPLLPVASLLKAGGFEAGPFITYQEIWGAPEKFAEGLAEETVEFGDRGLTAGGIASGAGEFLGMLTPSDPEEQRRMAHVSDELKTVAKRYEQLKDAGTDPEIIRDGIAKVTESMSPSMMPDDDRFKRLTADDLRNMLSAEPSAINADTVAGQRLRNARQLMNEGRDEAAANDLNRIRYADMPLYMRGAVQAQPDDVLAFTEEYSRHRLEYGSREMEFLGQAILPALLDQEGIDYVSGLGERIMRVSGVAQTGILESDVSIGSALSFSTEMLLPEAAEEFIAPLADTIEKSTIGQFGVPTVAGLDRMMQSEEISPYIESAFESFGVQLGDYQGIRDVDSAWTARTMARVATGDQGMYTGYPDILINAGLPADSQFVRFAQAASGAGDLFLPWETWALKPFTILGRFARAARLASMAPTGSKLVGFAAGVAPSAAARSLGVTDADIPSIYAAITDGHVGGRIDKGAEPLQHMPKEFEAQFDRVMEVVADPAEAKAALKRVVETNRNLHLGVVSEMIDNGTPQMKALRASEPYKVYATHIDEMVQSGILKADEAAATKATHEWIAMRVARDGRFPNINTPEQFFEAVSVRQQTAKDRVPKRALFQDGDTGEMEAPHRGQAAVDDTYQATGLQDQAPPDSINDAFVSTRARTRPIQREIVSQAARDFLSDVDPGNKNLRPEDSSLINAAGQLRDILQSRAMVDASGVPVAPGTKGVSFKWTSRDSVEDPGSLLAAITALEEEAAASGGLSPTSEAVLGRMIKVLDQEAPRILSSVNNPADAQNSIDALKRSADQAAMRGSVMYPSRFTGLTDADKAVETIDGYMDRVIDSGDRIVESPEIATGSIINFPVFARERIEAVADSAGAVQEASRLGIEVELSPSSAQMKLKKPAGMSGADYADAVEKIRAAVSRDIYASLAASDSYASSFVRESGIADRIVDASGHVFIESGASPSGFDDLYVPHSIFSDAISDWSDRLGKEVTTLGAIVESMGMKIAALEDDLANLVADGREDVTESVIERLRQTRSEFDAYKNAIRRKRARIQDPTEGVGDRRAAVRDADGLRDQGRERPAPQGAGGRGIESRGPRGDEVEGHDAGPDAATGGTQPVRGIAADTLRQASDVDDTLLQAGATGPRGWISPDVDHGRFFLRFMQTADMQTMLHETGHLLRFLLEDDLAESLVKHFGGKVDEATGRITMSRADEERVAEAFRWYLRTRAAPSGPVKQIFDRLRVALSEAWVHFRTLMKQPGGEALLPHAVAVKWDAILRPDKVVEPEYKAFHAKLKTAIDEAVPPKAAEPVAVEPEPAAPPARKKRKITSESKVEIKVNTEVSVPVGDTGKVRKGKTIESPEFDTKSGKWMVKVKAGNSTYKWPVDDLIGDPAKLWVEVKSKAKVKPPEAQAAPKAVEPEFPRVDSRRPGYIRVGDQVKSSFEDIGDRPKTPSGEARRKGQVDVRKDVVYQALGITDETKEMRIDDLVRGVARYVAADMARQSFGTADLVRLTTRTIVPTSRIKRIQKDSLEFMSNKKFDPEAIGVDRKTGDLLLQPDQAQALRDVVADVMSEPMSTAIPERLRDAVARGFDVNDWSRMAPEDYNSVVEAVIDTRAGAAASRFEAAEAVSPTAAHAAAKAIDNLVGKAQNDKYMGWVTSARDGFRDVFIVQDKLKGLNPDVKEAVQTIIRELDDVPKWLTQSVRDLRKADKSMSLRKALGGVMSKEGGLLRLPVLPAAISDLDSLVSFVNSAGRGLEEVSADFEKAAKYSNQFRVYFKPDVLDRLDGALKQGGFRSPTEERALSEIRAFVNSGADFRNASDTQIAVLEDSLRHVEAGARNRLKMVDDRGAEVIRLLGGEQGVKLLAGEWDEMKKAQIRTAYKLFNDPKDGDWKELLEFAGASSSTKVGGAQVQGLDILKQADGSIIEENMALAQLVIRMRMHDIVSRGCDRLTRAGVSADINRVVAGVAADEPPGRRGAMQMSVSDAIDKEKQIGRISGYLGEIVRGRVYGGATEAPPAKLLPASEMDALDIDKRTAARAEFGDDVFGVHDLEAYMTAKKLAAEWGIADNADVFKETMIFGKRMLVPDAVVSEVQKAVETVSRMYNEPSAIIGREGLINITSRIIEHNPLTTARIKMGMTTGLLIPNPAYFMGNFIGNILLAYQGVGLYGAAKYALQAPLAAMSAAPGAVGRLGARLGGNDPQLAGAVVARLWGHGNYKPDAKPIITKDGRIYTADSLTRVAQREGLRSSFLQAETTQSIARDLRDTEPGFWSKMMGKDGTWWTRKDAVTKKDVAAAPIEAAKWWQSQLTESATAIDNYFRVSIFVDALKAGKSEAEAAELARTILLDYGALTDIEKRYARKGIMFYSFMRKNMDQFFYTMARNPHRILGQARLIKDIHRDQIEGEPEIVLKDWEKSRFPIAFKAAAVQTGKQKVMYMLPPLPAMDAANFLFEVGSIGEGGGAKLLSKLHPMATTAIELATDRDLFSGTPLGEYEEVPRWFMTVDRALGGQFERAMDIEMDRIPDPMYAEVPGVPSYKPQSKSGKRMWFVWRNYFQFPMAGRSIDTLTALDRSNMGPIEAVTIASEKLYAVSEEMGIAEGAGVRPEAADAGPRPGLTELDEFLGLMGIKPRYVSTPQQAAAAIKDRTAGKIEEATRDQINQAKEAKTYMERRELPGDVEPYAPPAPIP